MRLIILILSAFYMPMFGLFAQPQSDSPKCENFFFDQMVKTSLDFTVPVIDVSHLHDYREEYTVLDARELSEYQVSHIKGAIHIGYDELNKEQLKKLDKNKPVAIYCSIGYRSEKVGEKLQKMGFKDVRNVYGSIFEWTNRGYELVNPQGRTVTTIHGYSRSWGIWIKKKNITVVYP